MKMYNWQDLNKSVENGRRFVMVHFCDVARLAYDGCEKRPTKLVSGTTNVTSRTNHTKSLIAKDVQS